MLVFSIISIFIYLLIFLFTKTFLGDVLLVFINKLDMIDIYALA